MLPHQERVVAEKDELDEKLDNLNKFITGPAFVKIPDAEQTRLVMQSNIMNAYSLILEMRIAAF